MKAHFDSAINDTGRWLRKARARSERSADESGSQRLPTTLVLGPNGAPEAMVIDLTRDLTPPSLDTAREWLERVPTVALVGGARSNEVADRLGIALRVRAEEPATHADAERAMELCRGLAASKRLEASEKAHSELVAAHRRALSEIADSAARHAMLAHDLRSPIAVIHAIASELRRQPSPASLLLNAVDRATRQMLGLVEQFEALHSGTLRPIQRERIDLRQLARTVVDALEHTAEGRTRTIRVEGEAVLEGDRCDLERILTNLINNALRHSRRNVEIVLDDAPNEVTLAVLDDGDGIDRTVRRALFEPFVRGARGGRMGLGLAIVRRAAERNGGRVDAFDGEDASGASFVVRFPSPGR